MKTTCWDFKKCGRGPDGDRSCPTALATNCSGINGGRSGGRVCWAVAGTMCGGRVQGSSAQKIATCIECDFFRLVRNEEGAAFCAGADVLVRLADRDGLERSYFRLIEAVGEVKRLSTELVQSQKLAAIGTLAAGIAHEINTPAQFVSDNIHFLAQGFQGQQALMVRYREAMRVLLARTVAGDALVEEIKEAEEAADLAYFEEEAPAAFRRALEGLTRISTIVGAMKEFAHADRRERVPADVNRALQNTLTVAKSEYKYVARVETDLGELPLVVCHLAEVNQAFLNLIVNAAHAVSDVVGENGDKGLIRVRTRDEGRFVRIEISDTGCGIPEDIRHRIYEPFFTTKEVGRGSGQGLAITRSVVMEKHGGSLTFESTVGKGTTFTVLLPVDEAAVSAPSEHVGAARPIASQ